MGVAMQASWGHARGGLRTGGIKLGSAPPHLHDHVQCRHLHRFEPGVLAGIDPQCPLEGALHRRWHTYTSFNTHFKWRPMRTHTCSFDTGTGTHCTLHAQQQHPHRLAPHLEQGPWPLVIIHYSSHHHISYIHHLGAVSPAQMSAHKMGVSCALEHSFFALYP